ncbi:hypothetical protein ACVWYG_001454 [Pedobacter sp. UYEF25]
MTPRENDNHCEKVTRLIEQKQFEILSTEDTGNLEDHLSQCPECEICQGQSELINNLYRKFLTEPVTKPLLEGDFIESLKSKINKKL